MNDQVKSRFKKLTEGKALKVAFIVSLALNLLVVGVIAGGMLNGKRPSPMGGYDVSLGEFGKALSRDDRTKIRDDLRTNPNFRLPSRGTRDEAVQAFIAAVRAEPFDVTVVEGMFASQRVRGAQAMQAGQDALLKRLVEMDAEERNEFADRVEHFAGRGKPDDR